MVFIGLGGNIGNKQENFNNVYKFIVQKIGKITKRSSVYETPPWGFKSEYIFWNQVLEVKTNLVPEKLLEEIHLIEKAFVRKSGNSHYSDREMDIDILYYDDLVIETEQLIIPHPRIQFRKFVLVPLVEISSSFKHPLIRLTNLEMLNNCRDESIIKKIVR